MSSLSWAGVWLKQARFDVGDFARIVVLDGMLVVSCEKIPENVNGEIAGYTRRAESRPFV